MPQRCFRNQTIPKLGFRPVFCIVTHKRFIDLLYALIFMSLLGCQVKSSAGLDPGDLCEPPDKVLAFPDAKGYGAWAVGGRNGKVLKVTNLQDHGEGSFRAAVEASFPRIVIFEVSGTIELQERLFIRNPFITIAGQSAPGKGITLKGADLVVKTSEVIIRGLRIRVGPVNDGEDYDGIALVSSPNRPINNVIIDHCSISWAIDENISTNGSNAPVTNITFSNNIISEGLNDPALHSKGVSHSMGMLLNKNGVTKVSVIGNLFAHNRDRQPKVGVGVRAEIVNNIIYNWENKATDVARGAHVNVVGNYYKTGLSWNGKFKAVTLSDEGSSQEGKLYLNDNLGPDKKRNASDEWDLVTKTRSNWKSDTSVVSQNTAPMAVDNSYDYVLDNVGAVPRDAIDSRVVRNVRQGTGLLIFHPDDVGGYLNFPSVAPPLDTDQDGIPDEYEVKMGLNPELSEDANQDNNCNGYSSIEEYLNSLITAVNP